MRELSQKISIRSFLTIGDYEEDEGFRKLLTSIARHGMMVAGLLGAISVLIFVFSHIFLLSKTVVWIYTDLPDTEIMLLDKAFIFALSLGCIRLSRSSLSLTWNRLLLSFVVWCACFAILLDDIASRDISFSTGYITITFMVAVGTIPYTGWQTALLTLGVTVSTYITIVLARTVFGISVFEPEPAQIIYLLLAAVLLAGLSSLIYLNRYEQYLAHQRAERLKEELKERARVLEILKEKSEEQARKIRKHEKMKDRFFANISHEFRTPLTLIMGPLKDLLADRKFPEKKRAGAEIFRLMYRNGERLLTMINQLLDLSKIDAGEIRLNREVVNLEKLVRKTVLSFVPMAERRQVDLTFESGEGPVMVPVDSQQMDRVIGNLLSNALKFTPAGGEVSVLISVTGNPGREIHITVKDTGPGIPASEIPFIFDRFYQSTNTSGPVSDGTGIGLALVKEIVELHGGRITVQSQPGSGSEFKVILDEMDKNGNEPPASPREDALREQHPETRLTEGKSATDDFTEAEDGYLVTGKDPKVVLVDDNPDILEYLKPWLTRRYNLLAFERSDQALRAIRKQGADLIISDIMMPEPDGFELCRVVKNDPGLNHIPVILLTARAGEENKLEGLKTGADDYINKPFSASELMVRVENLIDLRRMLRRKFSEEIQIKGKSVEVSSEDARFLKQVQSVIEEYMENSNFGVDWLADEVNLSSRQLQRKIRAVTDLSAGGYIRFLRLERASQLLAQKWGNISEISYKVGFQDSKYFSTLFKQTFGVSPTEFSDKQL